MLSATERAKLPEIPTVEMTKMFTSSGIKDAIKSLRDNKCAGADDLMAEQLKHGPSIVYDMIPDILNTTARTGKYPQGTEARSASAIT